MPTVHGGCVPRKATAENRGINVSTHRPSLLHGAVKYSDSGFIAPCLSQAGVKVPARQPTDPVSYGGIQSYRSARGLDYERPREYTIHLRSPQLRTLPRTELYRHLNELHIPAVDKP